MNYPVADLIGILLMVIPVCLSLHFPSINHPKFNIIPNYEKFSVNPVSAFFAFVIVAAYAMRYDFFKKETLLDVMISAVRLILDTWVLATIIELVLYTDNSSNLKLLILTVIVSWMGMKSIAGYSWFLLLLLNFDNISEMNKDLGDIGAIFLIISSVGLLFQVTANTDLKQVQKDFYEIIHR